jgi:hypothetical protein
MRRRAGSAELATGGLGEPSRPHFNEHLVRGAQALARVGPALLTPQS